MHNKIMKKKCKLKNYQYKIWLIIIFFYFLIPEKEILANNKTNFNDLLTFTLNDNFYINFYIENTSYYRTAEIIEITGNEDSFNSIFNFSSNINYIDKLDNNNYISYSTFIYLSIFPQISTKERFYEYFNHQIILLKNAGLNIDFIKNNFFMSTHFAYEKNIVLNYNFENFNMPIIYDLPTYPINFSNYIYNDRLPFFPFILGDRMLPIYYFNAIHYYDTNFYITFKFNLIKSIFNLSLGASNGEDGLDSNSAKSVIFKILLKSKNFDLNNNTKTLNKNLFYNDVFYYIISLSGLIGNRGSVPAKVYSHQYSFYFEVGKNRLKQIADNIKNEPTIYKKLIKNKITFAFEAVFTVHGFTKPYINPYDPSYNNFPQQYETGFYGDPSHITAEWESFINLYQYDFGNTYFLPDDLPNIDNPGSPLFGAGGFIYFGFLLFDNLRIFTHFSIYDSNILSNKIIPYEPRYRILGGFKFNFTMYLSFIFSFSYTYDPVYYKFASQFYDAENRENHSTVDYDLFFGINLKF